MMGGTTFSVWLVDSFIAFTALILLVLLLRRPVARWFGPEAAYLLWCLPALRWLMPPLALESLGISSIMQRPETAPVESIATDVVTTTPQVAVESPDYVIDLLPLLPTLWLAGAGALFLLLIRHHLKVMGEMKAGAGRLGAIGKVTLYESDAATSPLASGFLNRSIFVPQSIRHWPDDVQRMAVAHEMTHHRAHHLFHNMAALVLLCLNWFNPLAWIAARAFIVDQEADCDARTISKYRFDRGDYSTMLLEAAKISPGAPMTLAPHANLIPKSALVARIRKISMDKNDSKLRFAGYGLAALTGLALLPLTASIAQTDDVKSMSVSSRSSGKSVISISGGTNKEPTYRRDVNYKGKTYELWSDRELSDAEVRHQFEQSEKAVAKADVAVREAEIAAREGEAAARRGAEAARWGEEEAKRAAEEARWAAQENWSNGEAAREAAEEARQNAEEARRDAQQHADEARRDAQQAADEARHDAQQAAEEARRDAAQAASEARRAVSMSARAEAIRSRAIAQADAARIRADAARRAIATVEWNGVRASVDGAEATVRTISIDNEN